MYGVYVHVPWCRIRCPYCAFAVDTSAAPSFDAFREGVLRDWEYERSFFEGRPETLFFGGGTPSRQPATDLAALIAQIAPRGEVSLEANPEDVSVESCAAWLAAGVNRLSIGVQSFSQTIAPRLGRAHSSRQAEVAVVTAINAGFRTVSVDLIFGLEGQTLESWASDLDKTVALGVQHVSTYGLSIEPDTDFAARNRNIADDDDWAAMYDLALHRLEAAGICRYEVSNFAQAGHRCIHNEHYWRARRWAGLGPSAHGWRPSGARTSRPPTVAAWRDSGAPCAEEIPTNAELFRELAWSTLRHADGLARDTLRATTGFEVRCPVALIASGLVTDDGSRIRLSGRGWMLADGIADRLATASGAGAPGVGGAYLAHQREADGEESW